MLITRQASESKRRQSCGWCAAGMKGDQHRENGAARPSRPASADDGDDDDAAVSSNGVERDLTLRARWLRAVLELRLGTVRFHLIRTAAAVGKPDKELVIWILRTRPGADHRCWTRCIARHRRQRQVETAISAALQQQLVLAQVKDLRTRSRKQRTASMATSCQSCECCALASHNDEARKTTTPNAFHAF
eukprot:6200064-Pleurochrysis_carterae.AAC.2